MTLSHTSFYLLLLWIAALLVHCGPTKVSPAHDPRRPKPIGGNTGQFDCNPTPKNPRSLPPAVQYRDRVISESNNLTSQGKRALRRARSRSASTREKAIQTATAMFINALAADPYNVDATYHLAATYARVGRSQCAVNLLDRLAQLGQLRSYKAAVRAYADQLFGRGRYRDRMDSNFRKLRGDQRFRVVARKFR